MNHYQALTIFIFTHADNVMTEIHIKYLYNYPVSLFLRYACLHNITIYTRIISMRFTDLFSGRFNGL